MDNIDTAILDCLKENGRVTASEISKKVKLSIPAVAERIRKLEQNSIIQKCPIYHMELKLAGYVRRRHYDCKWFLIWIYFCVEVSVVHPFFVQTILNIFRIICLC